MSEDRTPLPGVVKEDIKEYDAETKGEDTLGDSGGSGNLLSTIGGFVKDVGSAIGSAFTFGKPDADLKHIHVKHLSMDDAQIEVDVEITNPNPVPIPLVDIDYLIEVNNSKLVSGLIPDAGTIHAHGSEVVKIPVNINFKEITDTFDDINPGQIVKYLCRVTLIIDVPVFGRFSIPLDTDGEFPIPQKPDIDLEKVKFQSFSMSEAKAILHFKVENFNPFDLGVNKLSADIKFGDVSVGEVQYDEKKAVIEKGADGEGPCGIGHLEMPIMFRPKELGSGLWSIIRGKGTAYTINGLADVDTPFGAMQLPFVREGGQTKFKGAGDEHSDDDD